MDTFKIKAVMTAAKYKSMSRAAEDFSYTPSAFSHMIASFEEKLGIKLFCRTSTGVFLTDEGEKLMPYFSEIIKSEESLEAAAAELAGKKGGELRVGSFSSISRNLLTKILGDFKRKYPNVRLSVSVADNLEGWLEDGRVDIIFADDSVYGENKWFPIMEDKYLAVFPSKSVIEGDAVTREELYRYPYIFTEDSYLKEYFDLSRFSELIHFRSEDDLSVIKTVKEGLGVAVLPELAIKEHIDGVATRELYPPVIRTLGFAYKKKKQMPPALEGFIEYIKAIYKQ